MKSLLTTVALIALAAAMPRSVHAAAPHSSAAASTELNRCIAEVIVQPEYSWRAPRGGGNTMNSGLWNALGQNTMEWITGVARAVKLSLAPVWKLLKRFSQWLESLFKRDAPGTSHTDWQGGVRIFLFILLAIFLSMLAIQIHRIWKRSRVRTVDIEAQARPTVSDMLAERVVADQLPVDEWMDMARSFIENGQYRLALRAMFLACLVHLSNNAMITISPCKSNLEYMQELKRRAHDLPDLLVAFSANTADHESTWYGTHPATRALLDSYAAKHQLILASHRFATKPQTEG